MGLDLGKKFKLTPVGGFTLTKQIKFVNENGDKVAFSKEKLKGDISNTSLDVTADKDGKEILFSFRQGDFINVYGEKLGELYAKSFRCRKPLLLKTSGGEFHLRTNSIWQVWLAISKKYVLEGKNGIEATYRLQADKNGLKCEIAENPVLPQEVVLALGALMLFKPLHVSDSDNPVRVIDPEDEADKKDARFFIRVSVVISLLLLAGFILKVLALIFD